jgi:hypothetical protein
MRDPLLDLVHRTRRPESAVQPRLSSAYETSQQAMHDIAVDEVVTRDSTAARLPISTSVAQAPATPTMPRERHDSPAIAASAVRRLPPAGEPVDHDTRPARPAAPASSDAMPHPAVPVAFVKPERVPEPVASVAPESVARVPAIEAMPREARRPHAIAAIQPATRVDRPQVRRLGVEPTRQEPIDTREQPAPEIRISIGRIEVRATAAERPSARRQPASPPPLTLDDYLAARARRGTR